jgi:hypothetical protein
MDISEKLEKILFRKPTYEEVSEYFHFAYYEIGDSLLSITEIPDGTWLYSIKKLDEEYAHYVRFSATSSELYTAYSSLLENAVFDGME